MVLIYKNKGDVQQCHIINLDIWLRTYDLPSLATDRTL